MRKYFVETVAGFSTEFLNIPRLHAISWRDVAIDTAIVAVFLVTSSWFIRG
jgi:hypothetical protein